MPDSRKYVLGQSADAARRLQIQDAQLGKISEQLLDDLRIGPADRVVEVGIGAGGFSRRILRRLGNQGVLVGVDYSTGLLEQARQNLAECGPARFEPVFADISRLGPWLDQADVVVGRTVVHHIPMAEEWLGRLKSSLRPGTRVGFIEPEFRVLLGRLAILEAAGRPELAVLRLWAEGIIRFYEVTGLSPQVGATMGWTLEAAGYQNVRVRTSQSPTDETVIENLLLYYDEIREKYQTLGIMTSDEIDRQKEQLRSLDRTRLPSVWGVYGIIAVA